MSIIQVWQIHPPEVMESIQGTEYRYPKHRGVWLCRTEILSCCTGGVKAMIQSLEIIVLKHLLD